MNYIEFIANEMITITYISLHSSVIIKTKSKPKLNFQPSRHIKTKLALLIKPSLLYNENAIINQNKNPKIH